MKLLRYIQGLRKGKDAHRIEKDAMTDPFLADALEGFDEVDGSHTERIERMQRRIAQLSQKNRHIAAIAAAKKAASQPLPEVMAEETLCADMSVAEAKEFISREPLATEKKKRRSLVVWLAAAVMLLFLATGGYFWLLKEDPTAPQLAVTESKQDVNKEALSSTQDEVTLNATDTNELIESSAEAIAQDVRREQQAVSQPMLTRPISPSSKNIDAIAEMEIKALDLDMIEAKEVTAYSDKYSGLGIDSILNFNVPTLSDSGSLSLFARKEVEKIHPSASVATIYADELGIHSNTNRSALSQTLFGKVAGVQANEKQEAIADPHALTQSQLYSQGKLGGKLSEQSKPTTSRTDQRKSATSIAPAPSSSLASGAVTGRVVDQYGEPIPFVNVQVKGTTAATTTDMEGYFALNAKNAEKIVASFIGYDKIELPVDTTKPMTIAMNESATQLDEMVVVAYGVNRMDDYSPDTGKTIPEPEMGYSAYRRYLSDNLATPTDECANVKGRVVLTFNVNSSGRPYNIQVKRSLCPSADQEAIRLVNEGGRWTIGDGQVRLSIKF